MRSLQSGSPPIEDGEHPFPAELRACMQRGGFAFTPGLVAKLSGISKGTIVNWLRGVVRRPRDLEQLAAVADAMRLHTDEREALFRAAGHAYVALGGDFPDVPMGLYRTTPDGRILAANRTLVHMLGCPDLRSYLTVTVRDLYAEPADRGAWQDRIRRLGTLREVPVLARRADGSTLWVRDTARAVRAPDGTILCYEGSWDALRPDGSTTIVPCIEG